MADNISQTKNVSTLLGEASVRHLYKDPQRICILRDALFNTVEYQWRLLTNFSGGATVLMIKMTRYMGKLIGSKTIATLCYFLVTLLSNTKCNSYREKLHPGVFNQ